MGHERVGVLPRTKTWQRIVDDLSAATSEAAGMPRLAGTTLAAVRERYERVPNDAGVEAAFEFLVGLSNAARSDFEAQWRGFPVDLADNPTALQLTRALQIFVSARQDSLEYADLAVRAAADVIGQWHEKHGSQQGLFGVPSSGAVWADATTAAGFCEISRIFFGRLTERYLRYFLEREASAALPSIDARDAFDRALGEHANSVSRHAFESAKIMQSFAAGWFEKNARGRKPTRSEVRQFLRKAFAKMRDELAREPVSA